MRLVSRLAALATCLACAAARRPPDPGGSPVIAVIERTGCFGDCPSYRLTLHENGVLLFQRLDDEAGGSEKEPLRGRRLSVDELGAMARAFERAGFARLASYERDDCTDFQTVTLEWRGHTVVHYWGDQSAPRALYDLEGELDRIAGSRRWLGSDPHQAAPMGTTCMRLSGGED